MLIDQRLFVEEETSPWTPLEKSMISLRGSDFHGDATQPVAKFLQDIGIWLRARMEGQGFMEDENHEVRALN